jgi:hypothetical protein
MQLLLSNAELARRQALTWMARQRRWEERLAELHWPGGDREPRRRRSAAAAPLRRAG